MKSNNNIPVSQKTANLRSADKFVRGRYFTSVEGWYNCLHDWHEVDSQFCNEYYIEVECILCGCRGEKNLSDSSVYWPTT